MPPRSSSTLLRAVAAKACLALIFLLGCLGLANADEGQQFRSQYKLLGSCGTDALHTPTNTKQVASLVSQYHRAARNASVKVSLRTSHPSYHSTASFPCPGSSPGSSGGSPPKAAGAVAAATVDDAPAGAVAAAAAAGGNSGITNLRVGLLNTRLNRVLAVDKAKLTMRVGSGMLISELTTAATKANMSIQISTLPFFSGLTVGGVFLTSAHGSGFMSVHSLAETVLEVTWVDGTGKVRTSRRADPEFMALPGSLGRLGIVTELLLQLTPPTATRLVTINSDDSNMFEKIQQMLQQTPYLCVMWSLDAGLIRAFQLFPVFPGDAGAKVEPRARMDIYPDLTKLPKSTQPFVKLLGQALDIWSGTTDEDSTFTSLVCPQTVWFGQIGTFWAAVGSERVSNVTGPTNAMLSSDCGAGCPWVPDFPVVDASWHDIEFAIEFEQLPAVIADMRRIIDVELRESGKAPKRCLLSATVSIRFGKPADSLIGMTAGLAQPVFVQAAWYRSNKHPDKPIHYQFVADLFEELLLCKYNARPHPGKNFDRTFSHPRCPIAPRYPRLPELLQQAQRFDPAGLFSNDLFNKLAQSQAFQPSPRCTLTQACYCSADEHCPEGFACIPSLAFAGYRVCKSPMVDKPGSAWSQVLGALG